MTIFTIENLYFAYKECIKNKKRTINALKFEIQREPFLFQLLRDLQTRNYTIERHIYFVVTHPAPREIFAGDFRDRIVQHLLCKEIQALIEKDFSEHSFANRVGKGTHKAVKECKFYIRRGGINRSHLYYLKMDIKSFFRSMDKAVLLRILTGKIMSIDTRSALWKEEVLWLIEKIISNDPSANYLFKGNRKDRYLIPKHKSLFFGDKHKGLPIGNLTSQFFANVYLDALDHFVEDTLGITRYIRYVDDFVVFHESIEYLRNVEKEIESFLRTQLNLSVCKDKTILKNITNGIDFLGYFIKPTHTLVRRKIVRRFKGKLKKSLGDDGLGSPRAVYMINSYLGHFKHAHSFRLIRSFRGGGTD